MNIAEKSMPVIPSLTPLYDGDTKKILPVLPAGLRWLSWGEFKELENPAPD